MKRTGREIMFERTTPHILIIEDNPQDVDLLRHALGKTGARLILDVARDGDEALAFIKTWEAGASTPILILLDLNLPKMNGFEVLKNFKTHPRYRALPVVILTASGDSEDMHRSYALGANSYLLKSIDYDQFSQAIRLIYRYWCVLNVRPE
jgi:CheY-like chemotaxis protein